MPYNCIACNYVSNDKSNYTRHMKSAAHLRKNKAAKLTKKTNTIIIDKSVEYKCECGKVFSHHPSLSRHKKDCILIKKNTDIIELKGEITELKSTVNNMNGLLFELVKNNKLATATTNNNNYKISVKNYIQQNYPDAPALKGPTNYAKLTYNDNELIDTLLYKYKHKVLHEYLGDFLVDYYKKDDPTEQSVWSSDISRLTYIVKESLEDKKSIWNHDYKGVKTKKCIIDPLLQHIKKYIGSYWENNVDLKIKKGREIDIDVLQKRQQKYNITYAIETEIDNGVLANDIIKYIASHFHMDKNIELVSEYFIDDE